DWVLPMSNETQLDSLIKKMAADHPSDLPSPGLIWWRAQILRKQEAKQRIERPVMIMRLLAAGACLIGFLASIFANGGQLQQVMSQNNWWLIPVGVLTVAAVVMTALVLLLLPTRS